MALEALPLGCRMNLDHDDPKALSHFMVAFGLWAIHMAADFILTKISNLCRQ